VLNLRLKPLAAFFLAALALPFQEARRPNVILILADDLGMGDVACCGGKTPTPRLDRLAAEGTRFARYTCASPICSPSRAGLLTGQFPGRWRITSFLQTRKGNRGCEQADFLDPRAPSLPRALKEAGYATAHFGKWHLGGGRDVTDAPAFAAYGYDEHAGTYESPEPHPDITATKWIWSDQDKVKRWERTAFFVDRTLDFLRRNAAKPCYVNLWPDDTHTPWVPAAGAPKGDSPENLRAVLVEFDRQIGRLLDGLRDLGLEKDTLVLFTSDNGPLPTFDRARAAGLRGSKLSLYEGGLRVPFLARWPGRVPAGRVDEETALSAVDLFPTLCAIAGAPAPAETDGEDLSAALLGKTVARKRPIFWEYGRNERTFAYPKAPGDRSPSIAVRDGNWKLLVGADGSGAELYDLAADPRESANVAERRPEIARALAARALAWRRSLPAARPNLVLFIADDLGHLDSALSGAKDVRTPNLKRLADAGMVFSHAFATSPACAPSRASLLTGLWPMRHGAMNNHAAPRADVKKLPAYLHELGYEVAAFGKVAHYNQDKLYGFDHYDKSHAAATVSAWLDARAPAKPLCLIVGTHQPHVPWPEKAGYDPAALDLPPTHVDTPETREFRARFYADVSVADKELGEVYDLARARLGGDTLFVFTSDHGAQWPFGKWNLYDAGTRVPLVAAWPGVVAPGAKSDALVSLADLLPTFIEVAGGAAPGDVDGRSFAEILRGRKAEHRDRIFATHSRDGNMNVYPIRSARNPGWKYIRNLRPDAEHSTHIDKGQPPSGRPYWQSWVERAKTDPAAATVVERYRRRPAEELYDLAADPHERRNLAADPARAEVLAGLRADLDAWMKSQGDEGLGSEK
jgi:arylsulfatase A-like enzyme